MSERKLRKTRVGTVVSDKMDKTVVVAIADNVSHPLYKKIIKRTVKFKAHDEENSAHVGDKVEIMETRPLSKDKRWRIVRIVERLGSYRLVGEYLYPYLSAALDVTGHCDTGGLDLRRGDPGRLQSLEAVLSVCYEVASRGLAFHSSAVLLAVFNSLWK